MYISLSTISVIHFDKYSTEAASDMVYRAISTASYQVALEKMEVTDLEDTSGNALVDDGYYDEI